MSAPTLTHYRPSTRNWQVIDRWGKMLTIIAFLFALVLLGMFLYNGWNAEFADRELRQEAVMSLLDRILLPVDFSDRSYGAVRYAEALADPAETEISVVHVSTPLTYELSALDVGGTVLSDLSVDRTAELRQQLDAFAAGRSEELPGEPVSSGRRSGSAYRGVRA